MSEKHTHPNSLFPVGEVTFGTSDIVSLTQQLAAVGQISAHTASQVYLTHARALDAEANAGFALTDPYGKIEPSAEAFFVSLDFTLTPQ